MTFSLSFFPSLNKILPGASVDKAHKSRGALAELGEKLGTPYPDFGIPGDPGYRAGHAPEKGDDLIDGGSTYWH